MGHFLSSLEFNHYSHFEYRSIKLKTITDAMNLLNYKIQLLLLCFNTEN